jgi:hypothetical protein
MDYGKARPWQNPGAVLPVHPGHNTVAKPEPRIRFVANRLAALKTWPILRNETNKLLSSLDREDLAAAIIAARRAGDVAAHPAAAL